ncbi:MAG TPA: helix-hairpin-helix domain-containing protein [Candidatus Polarisedimenticolaceae bacterium]|nr:helix-hairpin-helix domain-containing protein [Candidatus Polarisedimenticolaceae bacterium]
MRAMRVLSAALLCGVLAAAGVAAAPEAAKAAPAAARAGAVDLNAASEGELQEVPGIGPSLAKKIVDFRKENGPFKSVDDLLKVRGVGEKSLEKLRPHLTVGKK